MMAVLLLVTMLAPAVLMRHWRRPTPARIRYPRRTRSRARHVR
jgi:hypothetical protein